MPAPSPTAAGSAPTTAPITATAGLIAAIPPPAGLPSATTATAATPATAGRATAGLRAALGSPWPAPLIAPLLLALLALPSLAGSGASRIEVAINGMVCSFCAQGVERKLRSLPATESVNVNLEQRLVLLTLRPGATIADEQLRSLIRNAGFDVRQIRRLPAAP